MPNPYIAAIMTALRGKLPKPTPMLKTVTEKSQNDPATRPDERAKNG